MGPLAAPAFQPLVRAKLVRVPVCSRISAGVGGDLVAQPDSRTAPAKTPTMIFGARILLVSMQFKDEPVHLGADSDNHLAENVNHLSAVGINRSCSVRAR